LIFTPISIYKTGLGGVYLVYATHRSRSFNLLLRVFFALRVCSKNPGKSASGGLPNHASW
jgi:hypothetical protein